MSKVNRVHQRLARELSKKEGVGYQQALEKVKADSVHKLVAQVMEKMSACSHEQREELLTFIASNPLSQMSETEALQFINKQTQDIVQSHSLSLMTLENLTRDNVLSPQLYDNLLQWVNQGKSIVIVGEMGAGKTSLLQALLNVQELVHWRTALVEQNKELILPEKEEMYHYWLQGEGAEEPTIADLLKFSLRKNPQRLVLSEVTAEALPFILKCVLLTSAGHLLTTFHSKSAQQALTRMAIGLQTQSYSQEVAWGMLAEGIDIMVTISKEDGVHQVSEVHQVISNQQYQRRTGAQGNHPPALSRLYQLQNGSLQKVDDFDEN
jgi:Tfp pilus assembly ATPase PilU